MIPYIRQINSSFSIAQLRSFKRVNNVNSTGDVASLTRCFFCIWKLRMQIWNKFRVFQEKRLIINIVVVLLSSLRFLCNHRSKAIGSITFLLKSPGDPAAFVSFPILPLHSPPKETFPKPGHSIPSKPKVWLITCESPPYGARVQRCWSSGRRSEWLLWILCRFNRFYPIHSPCSYIILQRESLQIRIKQHHGIFLIIFFWETHFIPISPYFCRKAHVAMSKNKCHML